MAFVQSPIDLFRKSIAGKPPPTVVRGCSKTWVHGHIGVPELTLIVPTRGNASQDAPRPLLNVAQMRGQSSSIIHVMRSAH